MSFEEGDTVKIEGEDTWGVIAGRMTENFEWVTGEGEDNIQEVEASVNNPIYIVAMEAGGSKPFEENELQEYDRNKEIEEEDVADKADEAEMAQVYWEMDKPFSLCVESVETGQRTEELINIPKVDDPGVGFDSDPNGWDRSSYLDAWASIGGTWRSCRAEMITHFSPNMAERWCAALKDEVLGTERWRGRF